MPPTYADYLASLQHQERVSSTPATSIDTALGMIKTAAVSFDHLTNQPEWDRFLSMVQGKYEDGKREKDQSLSLCGGAVGDALGHAQLSYQYWRGYKDALEYVLGLPHQVMESYQELKK